MDKNTWTLERQVLFEGFDVTEMNMHLRCVKSGHKICFLPAGVQCAHIYDMEKGIQSSHSFSCAYKSKEPQEWNWFTFKEDIYLLPCYGEQGVWKWNIQTDAMEQEMWWKLPSAGGILLHGSMDEKRFYTLEVSNNQLNITNMESRVIESFFLPDEQVYRIVYDGRNFWYTVNGSTDVVCWNREEGVIGRFELTGCDLYEQEIMVYREMFYVAGKIFLFEESSGSIYMLDGEKGKVRKIYTVKCARGAFGAREMLPGFKCVGDKLLYMLRNAGEIVLIDLKTLEIRQYDENFYMDKEQREYMYEIAFKRNALLCEETGAVDLKLLLRHCMQI